MKNNKVSRKSKSNWLEYEAQIEKGESFAFDGWVKAYKDSVKWKSVQEYARESAKLSTTHTMNTISQYIGAVKMGVKRYGTVDGLLKAYDNVYTYRNITDLRTLVRGNGERQASDEAKHRKSKQSKPTVSRRQARAKMVKAGVPSKFIDIALDAVYGN